MFTYALMTPSYAPALSLHVPRIDTRDLGPQASDHDFVRTFVTHQFMLQGVGSVSRVDLLSKINPHGYQYYEAFVHFSTWYDNEFSLSLRRQACSPRLNARLGLLGTSHYWHVNESRSPVYEEDFQSILCAIPAARWVQAADEAELEQHQLREAERTLIDRWYKRAPTEEELAAVAKIEAFVQPRLALKTPVTSWGASTDRKCSSCGEAICPDGPESETFCGEMCVDCFDLYAWDHIEIQEQVPLPPSVPQRQRYNAPCRRGPQRQTPPRRAACQRCGAVGHNASVCQNKLNHNNVPKPTWNRFQGW
jgi:hypothetical protein